MTCAEIKLWMADYLTETLPDAQQILFESHLQSCDTCREETSRLTRLWRDLGSLPAETPGETMRARFHESLSAYRDGVATGGSMTRGAPFRWPHLGAIAAGIALLAAGVGIGYGWRASESASTAEIAKLQAEVSNMRQLVTLSLLQQSSASERLRGVSWAYRVEPSDTEVLSALVAAVNHDPSVNVRLAAVDALRPFGRSPEIRDVVIQALPREKTPIVQVALIDLAVDLREKQAAQALEGIASDGSADGGVRDRARWALEQLQ